MVAYVARHGETAWNREGRYQGQRESELTELGRRQARALADALAQRGVRRLYTSPLRRCADTAREVAQRLQIPVTADDRLLEIAHGTWEGRLRDEVAREDAERFEAWQRTPDRVVFEGGESLAEVGDRWKRFAASLPGHDSIAVVTHDVLVRLAILSARGLPSSQLWKPRVENGGYAVFEVESGNWKLVEECCARHLEGLLADTSRQAL